MPLPKEQVVTGLVEELTRFHGLIVGLAAQDWHTPTRCEGSSVGDLAAHVTGVFADISAGRLEGAGTQPWYDRQVAERRGESPAAVTAELAQVIPAMRARAEERYLANWGAPGPPGVPGTLGTIAQGLWTGVYIHAEDVLAAVGRPPLRGPGLRAAVETIADSWNDAWGGATLALDGMERMTLAEGGRDIPGDPLEFVLAATGRADPRSVGLPSAVNLYA